MAPSRQAFYVCKPDAILFRSSYSSRETRRNPGAEKPMIKATIFDMDGLLIDSEPLWRRAEKSALRRVGIELTDRMCHETLGLRTDEVVSHWYDKFPWSGSSHEQVELELLATVGELISAEGRLLGGVLATLTLLRDAGLRLGIASSSPAPLIETVVETLGVRHYFTVMSSAADEKRGKPDPAVYLSAARQLRVSPVNCVAFEDSMAGVQSAKSAGMSVIAIPAERNFYEPDCRLADRKLRSLLDFSIEMLCELTGQENAGGEA